MAKSLATLSSQIIVQLLRTLLGVETLAEVAQQALMAALRLTESRHGAVFLVDNQQLVGLANTGEFRDLRGKSIALDAYTAHKIYLIRNSHKESNPFFSKAAARKLLALSLVSIPILSSQRELLGVLVVGFELPTEPDEPQINQLGVVCTTISSTLERIHHRQRLQTELAEKHILLELSTLLEGNTEEKIREALEVVRKIAGADAAVLIQAEGDRYYHRFWAGMVPSRMQQAFVDGMPKDHILEAQTILGLESQVLDNQEHILTPTMKRFGVKASLALSLNTDDPHEALVLHRFKERKGWNEAEMRLLRSAAYTLGAVATRVARAQQLEARNRELEIVAAVSKLLNTASSVEQAGSLLAEQIVRLTHSDQAAVRVLSPDGSALNTVAIHGFAPLIGSSVPKGKGLNWLALKTHQPVLTQDSLGDSRVYFQNPHNQPISSWPRSVAYVPMFNAEGNPLGTLGLAYWEANRIRPQDIETLEIIANIAASTLERLAQQEHLATELRGKELLLELSHLIESNEADSLARALARVRELAAADLVILGTRDHQAIRIQHYAGEPILPIYPDRQIPLERLYQLGMRLGERLHVPYTGQDPRFVVLQRFGIGSFYLTTATLETGIESGLSFYRREVRPWSDLERRAMDGAARMIGALLARVEANRRLSHQLRETQTLRNTIQAVAKNQFGQIWPDLLRAAVEIVPGAEAGSIFLKNGDGYQMVAQQGYSDDLIGIQLGPEIKGYWFGSEQALLEGVPRLGNQEFILNSLQYSSKHLHPQQIESLQEWGKMAQIRATLCVPIVLDNELYAYINLDSLSDEKAIDAESARVAQQFALQIGALVAAQKLSDVRQAAYEGALRAIGLALEARDAETAGHTDRVAQGASRLGKAIGLSQVQLSHLRWGAYLHDIGKLMIPDSILQKPGSLTSEERRQIMRHAVEGEALARQLPFLPEGARVVIRYHHERWDGQGYPDGLKGEEIPLKARIFAVCDVFDALISERPYKKAMTLEQARQELQQSGQSGHLDPRLVELFLQIADSR